jgi:hypothetical protein
LPETGIPAYRPRLSGLRPGRRNDLADHKKDGTMSRSFDARIQEAVRKAGKDALPSRIYEQLIGPDASYLRTLFGPSIGRVMFTLRSLTRRGVLSEGMVVDQKGYERRVYSLVGHEG